jgi:hypothetical protein
MKLGTHLSLPVLTRSGKERKKREIFRKLNNSIES